MIRLLIAAMLVAPLPAHAVCPSGAEGYGCRVGDILDAHDRWLAKYLHFQELCTTNTDYFACEEARELEEWAAQTRDRLGDW